MMIFPDAGGGVAACLGSQTLKMALFANQKLHASVPRGISYSLKSQGVHSTVIGTNIIILDTINHNLEFKYACSINK